MNTETLRILVAKGLSAADILEIAETLEAAPARSAGAERQARYRARKNQSLDNDGDVTRDVKRDVTGCDAEPSPSSPPLSSPPTPQQTPPLHPHPEGSDAPTRTRRASWPKSCPPPPGVSEDQWAGFVAHRKAKRQPLTDRAYQLLVAKLADLADDGHPPGEMIDRAVERGWTTVFPPDEKRNGSAHHDRPSAWAPRHGLDGVEPASLDD